MIEKLKALYRTLDSGSDDANTLLWAINEIKNAFDARDPNSYRYYPTPEGTEPAIVAAAYALQDATDSQFGLKAARKVIEAYEKVRAPQDEVEAFTKAEQTFIAVILTCEKSGKHPLKEAIKAYLEATRPVAVHEKEVRHIICDTIMVGGELDGAVNTIMRKIRPYLRTPKEESLADRLKRKGCSKTPIALMEESENKAATIEKMARAIESILFSDNTQLIQGTVSQELARAAYEAERE